ncbi:MSP domain protein [Oesophagostomum dentatum]|uniref:Major sperm protein n=1 Tax=Oesophagostomum dentatum TaxID=61180 RepID=A0A0B1SG57_OESDE|nr:MSP domain protein [Oesophagostomum dentatum]
MTNVNRRMLVIQNQSDRRVMFKMKSTRPGVYKMKPVFGVVNPGDKSSVRLVFMGIKVGYRIPVNDRITIVLAAVAQKGPADGRALASATEGEMRKRRIYILFKGVNDQKEIVDALGSKEKSAENVPEKGMKLADQQTYMNGYDEGYKVALLEKLMPKGAQGPVKALEQIRATKGIVS